MRVIGLAEFLDLFLTALHPAIGKFTGLNVLENFLHLGFRVRCHNARAGDIFTELSCVGNRIIHIGNAAFVNQVNNEFDLVQAFKIGHFRRITGFSQGLVTGFDQLDHATAQNGLLAKQVGFAFVTESRLNNARTTAADAACIRQRQIAGCAAGVLGNRYQTRHTAAFQIFTAHCVARAFRRHHGDVKIGTRLNEVEMNRQAVGEHQRRAFADIIGDMLVINILLQLIRRQDHDDIGPSSGMGNRFDSNPLGFGFGGRGRALAQADANVSDAAIAQVQQMCMALRAIADNGDFFAFDQFNIRIAVIQHFHK